MLKRQRPASPPPAIPVVPLLPPDDFHATKRQRIQPPSLDGPSRGWNPPPSLALEDSDEEYIDDNDDAMGSRRVQGGPPTGAYKEVNSLLHDLHAEHQYRRVLSSPSCSFPFTTRNTPPPLAVHLPSHKYPSNPVPLPSFAPDSRSSSRPTHFPPHPPGDGDGRSLDEGQCVQERYEDTNRLLRSVFLHRRQELERTVAQFPGW